VDVRVHDKSAPRWLSGRFWRRPRRQRDTCANRVLEKFATRHNTTADDDVYKSASNNDTRLPDNKYAFVRFANKKFG
jgi:hypothetical protein